MADGQVAAGGDLIRAVEHLSAVAPGQCQDLVQRGHHGGGLGGAVRSQGLGGAGDEQIAADPGQFEVAVGEPEGGLLAGEVDEGRQCPRFRSSCTCPDGSTRAVAAINDQKGLPQKTVYDLTVGDLHTFYVLAGNAPVLVHNNNCPRQIDYASDELSTAAFNYRVSSGYWDAQRNVAVANVRSADGSTRLVYGNSGGSAGHAEQDIVNQLKQGDEVIELHTDRAPCPDVCAPLLSGDPRTKKAIITYVIPYASPETPEGRTLNKAWADYLATLIATAKKNRGIG
ncbi:nucleic acid/nucleotide deaminase domain-containing protein [Kitasatospora sp. NPDC008050]|uniref:nucleic acid/nucleotide deaminase domain-containing protein n=1 Tax=Kitasatospora sp. NPDC008050 TaxID=3364021 RepID=UPI0036E0BCB1